MIKFNLNNENNENNENNNMLITIILSILIILISINIIIYFKLTFKKEKQQNKQNNIKINEKNEKNEIKLPEWYNNLIKINKNKLLDIKEWKNNENYKNYRKDNGWKGNDYMHSISSHVRIYDYILTTNENNEICLISCVHFTKNSESHQGLCHGGTMCAVMDDVIGWTGFCESGKCIEWSGYTVQINTSLKKAIPIDSVLKVEGWIEKREGHRKIHIKAKLTDENGEEHAVATGLFLKK